MRKRITLVIAYGQSNEKGTAVIAAALAGGLNINITTENVYIQNIFGSQPKDANANDLGLAYITNGGMFNCLTDALSAYTGWDFELFNPAKGNTSPVHDWIGWDSGTETLKNVGESGYDPYGNIASAIGGVTAAIARGREVWVITAGGQKDIGRLGGVGEPTIDDTIEANRRVQQLLIDSGASKTFCGITPKYLYNGSGTNYESFWDSPNGFVHVVQRGLLEALPNSYAGADLSVLNDSNLCAKDDTRFIHLNYAGCQWAAEKWLIAMRDAGVLG